MMNDPWIFPDWPVPMHVHGVVTTRDGPGVSAPPFARFNLGLRSGDSVDAVTSNRHALQQSLDLPAAPRWLHQVHGTRVAELGPLPSDVELQADAAVSRLPGTVLAILSADCLPVLLLCHLPSKLLGPRPFHPRCWRWTSAPRPMLSRGRTPATGRPGR